MLVTDGVLERNARHIDILDLLAATADLHPREAVQETTAAVLRAVGGRLDDDAAVLCLDWYGGGGERDRRYAAGANHHLASPPLSAP